MAKTTTKAKPRSKTVVDHQARRVLKVVLVALGIHGELSHTEVRAGLKKLKVEHD